MVRRPKQAADLNDGSIAALLTMTTPDALITGVCDNKEYPLVLIEFTEAVTTEDHELQRTYGAIAAYLAGAYYLKLAGEKKSEKEFGGAKYNPYSTPKIFYDEVNYEGYIIAKWETVKGNSYTLQRNDNYPSCPPDIAIFSDTIKQAVSAFIKNPTVWYKNSLIELQKQSSYLEYRQKVNDASGAKELLDSWKTRRNFNLNKLRYFVQKNWIGAKINRFSHAMDPDRGILTFISFLLSENRKVYGIYALKRTSPTLNIDINSIDIMRTQLYKALQKDKKDGGGVTPWFEKLLTKAANNAKTLKDEIDITNDILKDINETMANKVVMTLLYFLDGIYLNHNGILVKWDKQKLVNSKNNNFAQAFAQHFGFTKYVEPTPITEIYGEVDEDEVTYAIVHRVLIPNRFNIVSISYPGSQGGGAVLPKPELGKAQPREYPDVIALPPKGTNIDVVLNESKGMFNKTEVEKDLNKLLFYKTDRKHLAALQETLLVAQVINVHKQICNIVIGVSFGTNSSKRTSWNPSKVDFIFRIVDRTDWAIGIFSQQMKNTIKDIQGKTNFPKVFKCDKSDTLSLF